MPRRSEDQTHPNLRLMQTPFDAASARIRIEHQGPCNCPRRWSGSSHWSAHSSSSSDSWSNQNKSRGTMPIGSRYSTESCTTWSGSFSLNLSPPASPIRITLDSVSDNQPFPSSYRVAQAQLLQGPPHSVLAIVRRPTPFIRSSALLGVAFITQGRRHCQRVRVRHVIRVGETWVHFCAEREDWEGADAREVELVVPRVWAVISFWQKAAASLHILPSRNTYPPFNLGSDAQMEHGRHLPLPSHLDFNTLEDEEACRRSDCIISITIGARSYVVESQ